MPDVRNFRKYLEELSGNNYLKKKMAALEKKNSKMEALIDELKDEMKLIRKLKNAPPKKKGRKPRTMIKVIEDEMAKKKNRTMRVADIVKMLKQKKVKTKAGNIYSSVAASLTHNPRFEKTAPGEFKLKADAGDAKPPKKRGRKPGGKKAAGKPKAKATA